MVIESGYGDDFGVGNGELKKWFKDVLPHDAMFNPIDIILMAKPTKADLPDFLNGQILWGGPIAFSNENIEAMKPGALIVDVSCDENMGFEFATPTSFADPVVKVGKDITYYAVDHTPSYLFRASSVEISLALLPYLKTVMSGAEAWEDEIIIRKAIEVSKIGKTQEADMQTATPKTAIVTGASKGIGKATAILLGSNRIDVVVNYNQDAAGAQDAVQTIEKKGGRAIAVQVIGVNGGFI